MTRFAGLLHHRGPCAGDGTRVTAPDLDPSQTLALDTRTAGAAGFIGTFGRTLIAEGPLHLTGDIRLDGRTQLEERLAQRSQSGARSDAALVLEAYKHWGSNCTDHLLGDFAFGIYNGRTREWFCARDHFGVKPFYFVANGARFIFSNTPDALRHDVGTVLNERAVADFLLVGINPDLDSSSLASINMLPPAHTLSIRAGESHTTRRYWSLQAQTRVARNHPILSEFTDQFSAAVAERLPDADGVSIALSGGLDSSAVAAFAARNSTSAAIKAVTIDDSTKSYTTEEARYAQITANALGLEHVLLPHGDWSPPALESNGQHPSAANPVLGIPGSATDNLPVSPEQCGRVILTGHGADPLFTPNIDYIAHHLRHGAVLTLLRDWWTHVRTFGRRPPLYLHTIRLAARQSLSTPLLPPWLRDDVVRRLELPARLSSLNEALAGRQLGVAQKRSNRAGAIAQLSGPFWPRLFESLDVGFQHSGRVEFRHPWFDLRVVNLLLATPELPWCHDKHLLREALRGHIPDAVRCRPKALVTDEPEHEMLKRHYPRWGKALLERTPLGDFVDADKFKRMLAQADKLRPHEYGLLARPLYLGNWFGHIGLSLG